MNPVFVKIFYFTPRLLGVTPHFAVIIFPMNFNFQHLLATKFFPPPPPVRRVERADLLSRIENGLSSHHPLTLVSAPAGYSYPEKFFPALQRICHCEGVLPDAIPS